MSFLGRYYRTYALDFWGFGESGKKRETYAVQDFVSLVDQFMEQLGIVNAPLVGHSMGGTVSLSVAIKYPQRANKVVVVGFAHRGFIPGVAAKMGRLPSHCIYALQHDGRFSLCHEDGFPYHLPR